MLKEQSNVVKAVATYTLQDRPEDSQVYGFQSKAFSNWH